MKLFEHILYDFVADCVREMGREAVPIEIVVTSEMYDKIHYSLLSRKSYPYHTLIHHDIKFSVGGATIRIIREEK